MCPIDFYGFHFFEAMLAYLSSPRISKDICYGFHASLQVLTSPWHCLWTLRCISGVNSRNESNLIWILKGDIEIFIDVACPFFN